MLAPGFAFLQELLILQERPCHGLGMKDFLKKWFLRVYVCGAVGFVVIFSTMDVDRDIQEANVQTIDT